MNKKQEFVLKRGDAVHQVFTRFADVVQVTPGLTDLDARLVALLSEGKGFALQQSEKSTPITRQKNATRKQIEEQVTEIAPALIAYAAHSGDAALVLVKKELRASPSKLKAMRDRSLHTFAAFVHQTAAKYPGKLEPYVTDSEIVTFKERIDAFDQSLPAPKNAQGKSKQITENLGESCEAIDTLLKEAIREKVNPWRTKKAEFYNAFENAMAISESHSTKTDKGNGTGTAPASETK
ncbi:MAG: hypothetical protein A2W97_18350 [Bacteroidetes bacterium GWE2_40_63]|nr:MAG: hypothetical protein A2W96_06545 [Bacteroidetes bacterium GWD2_40_43]OFX94683.1 MAG: hypothetical protein A2W97_18350 [Bacteroidetes bacterium GWE2_40_63]OFY24788.1 MAG: hypothetical protein A2W88_16965 [Bacteroidetes bacterium GWF2_40_13]